MPQGPSEELLRRVLGAGVWDDLANKSVPIKDYLIKPGPNLPPVETPPQFRPYPNVVGGQNTANAVYNLIRSYPQIQGRARRVMVGPSESVINDFLEQGGSPYEFNAYSSLLGRTVSNPTRGADIAINPSLTEDFPLLYNTLGHEFAHAQGYDEDVAYPVGDEASKIGDLFDWNEKSFVPNEKKKR